MVCRAGIVAAFDEFEQAADLVASWASLEGQLAGQEVVSPTNAAVPLVNVLFSTRPEFVNLLATRNKDLFSEDGGPTAIIWCETGRVLWPLPTR